MAFRIAPTQGSRAAASPLAAAPAAASLGDQLALVEPDHLQPSVALGVLAAAALALALGHWALSGRVRSLGWLAGVLGVLVAFAFQVWRDRRADDGTAMSAKPWFVRHLTLISLLAIAWGVEPLWFGLDAGLASSLLTVLALFLLAACGAYLLAPNRYIVALMVIPLFTPLVVVALLDASSEAIAIAVLGVVLLSASICFALNRRALLLDAARTKLTNDALVRELRQQVVLVEGANRDKSRFLAAASHDLRQPMHALGLFAASLERAVANSPLQPTVGNMMRAIDALEQSCSAMLDLSKLDAGVVEPNLQPFAIRDLFRRLHMHCAGQAEEFGLSLRFRAGGKIVTSDPQLLERVLANLIHNAIRYTETGGMVVVARTRSERICLEVWDTGIGIAEEQLPKIFDEFYQVGNPGRDRTRGLGMGLAIVKRLVILMGHELEVKSKPGHGTVFRILIAPTPMADMDNMVLGAETVPGLVDVSRTALVIDDEEAIRVGMRDLLKTWGFEVLLAGTIAQACAEVRRHAGVIDIVISDLRLANGEDGIDAIDRVRAVYGGPLPAVLITGDTSADEVKRVHGSGHQVLFKPVRPRDFYLLLRSVA